MNENNKPNETQRQKRYYWIKLSPAFLESLEVQRIMYASDGPTVFYIYTSLLVKACKHDGVLKDATGNQLHADEIKYLFPMFKPTEIIKAVDFLMEIGALEDLAGGLFMHAAVENVASESDSAERVRKHRARADAAKLAADPEPATNQPAPAPEPEPVPEPEAPAVADPEPEPEAPASDPPQPEPEPAPAPKVERKPAAKKRVNASEKARIEAECIEAIDYLNRVTGRNFSAEANARKDDFYKILKSHTKDELKAVIDDQWRRKKNDAYYSDFVRPSTIYRHFEEYLELIQTRPANDLYSDPDNLINFDEVVNGGGRA